MAAVSGTRIALVIATFTAMIAAESLDVRAQSNDNGIGGGPNAVLDESLDPIVLDGPWFEFSFSGVGVPAGDGSSCFVGANAVALGAPPWTFTLGADGGTLTITDAFLVGDAFEVFDFGVSIGTTPAVASGSSCGTDPDPCAADPTVSHATFPLDPGPHSITIQATVSPFISGCAYFRVDPAGVQPAPTTSTASLIAMAVILTSFGALVLRRRTALLSQTDAALGT